MKIPNRKFAIQEVCHKIEHCIPRLCSLSECDAIEAHVDTMYRKKLIKYPLYMRWKKGISNARNLLEEG